MRSFKILEIEGISLVLHWSFVFLFGFYFLLIFFFDSKNFFSTGMFLFFLFASVFFHELSHALVSKKLGIKVKKILLLPIGGVALASKNPKNPKHEFLISIAGPLFNFFVVFSLLFIFWLFPFLFPLNLSTNLNSFDFESILVSSPLIALLYVNLMLGSFNLFVPALPLDGGRIARSILAMGTGHYKATKKVVFLSKIVAVLLFFVGLTHANIVLMVIALFVYFGSSQEQQMAELQNALNQIDLERIVDTSVMPLSSEITGFQAKQFLLENNLFECPVRMKKGYAIASIEHLYNLNNVQLHKTLEELLSKTNTLSLEKIKKIGVETLLTEQNKTKIVLFKGNYYGVLKLQDIEKAVRFASYKK